MTESQMSPKEAAREILSLNIRDNLHPESSFGLLLHIIQAQRDAATKELQAKIEKLESYLAANEQESIGWCKTVEELQVKNQALQKEVERLGFFENQMESIARILKLDLKTMYTSGWRVEQLIKTEAQAAAMRQTLENIKKSLPSAQYLNIFHSSTVYDGIFGELHHLMAVEIPHYIDEAIASDAGKELLEVVKAAEILVDGCTWVEDSNGMFLENVLPESMVQLEYCLKALQCKVVS